jgi:hypothetical protein
MCRRINAQNFCKYLALTNLISFNFGYHVHEKAIMLVTIPLSVSLFQRQQILSNFSSKWVKPSAEVQKANIEAQNEIRIDQMRFRLLKFVMVWTFLPLFYTPEDTVTRLSVIILDWCLMEILMAYEAREYAVATEYIGPRNKIADKKEYSKVLERLDTCDSPSSPSAKESKEEGSGRLKLYNIVYSVAFYVIFGSVLLTVSHELKKRLID